MGVVAVVPYPVLLLLVGAVRGTLVVLFDEGGVADGGHLVRVLLVDHPGLRLLLLHPVLEPRPRHEYGRVHLGLHHRQGWRAPGPHRPPGPRGASEGLPLGLLCFCAQGEVNGDGFEDLDVVVHRLCVALAAGVARQRGPERQQQASDSEVWEKKLFN